MKRIVLALLLAVSAAVGVAVAADEPKAVTFTKADLGKVPAGWKVAQTGKGASVWKVVEDKTAPSKSSFALAQTTVWLYVDADNYYIARMNPLEDNFRVYKVVGG
jgi:hypothetical protein